MLTAFYLTTWEAVYFEITCLKSSSVLSLLQCLYMNIFTIQTVKQNLIVLSPRGLYLKFQTITRIFIPTSKPPDISVSHDHLGDFLGGVILHQLRLGDNLQNLLIHDTINSQYDCPLHTCRRKLHLLHLGKRYDHFCPSLHLHCSIPIPVSMSIYIFHF